MSNILSVTFGILLISFFASMGLAQSEVIEVRTVSVSKVKEVKVYGLVYNVEVEHEVKNISEHSVLIYGSTIEGYFDLTGRDWLYDVTTDNVWYRHNSKKALFRIGERRFHETKRLAPGSSFVTSFRFLGNSTCSTPYFSTPVYYSVEKRRSVNVAHSDDFSTHELDCD